MDTLPGIDFLPDIDLDIDFGNAPEWTGPNALPQLPLDLQELFESTSKYSFVVTGFTGQCQQRVKNMARFHPAVGKVIDMADCDAQLNAIAMVRDLQASMGMRRSWLKEQLTMHQHRNPKGLVVVVNIETDMEVDDLAWDAKAFVFAVDRPHSGVQRPLPCVDSQTERSFVSFVEDVISSVPIPGY